MTYDHILIRYGELGLKGKNQKQFLKTLVNNIRRQVEREIGDRPEVVREQGRLSIPLNGRNPADFYPALDQVFGISPTARSCQQTWTRSRLKQRS